MAIGGPDPPGSPWPRLCQDSCFCPGWIGGAMPSVPPTPPGYVYEIHRNALVLLKIAENVKN